MSYLKRPTLKLVLNRFKTSAEGWRSGESDNDAVQSLWQREGNYLSVLRTIQKRMEATLGSIIFPPDRNLRQLYAHCALNTCLYPFQCAVIALPLYASWAYSRSSYVNIALPLRLWRSWLCPRCCSDAFNCFTMDSCYDSTSAWPFQPVTLFLAERRPAALVLSLL